MDILQIRELREFAFVYDNAKCSSVLSFHQTNNDAFVTFFLSTFLPKNVDLFTGRLF